MPYAFNPLSGSLDYYQTAAVSSVFGRTGAVVANAGDYVGIYAAAVHSHGAADLPANIVYTDGAQDITGTKTIVYSGAGHGGLIIKQGPSQAPTDKTLRIQNAGGAEEGYYTCDYDGNPALVLRKQLVLGLPGTASAGLLQLWGDAGGLFKVAPDSVGVGALGAYILPYINRTAYFVTSTNKLSAIGTIAVLGSGGDPPTAAQQIGVVNKVAVAANYGNTQLTNTAPAGFYLVEAYIVRNTVGAAGCIPICDLIWHDGVATQGPRALASLTSNLAANQFATGIQLLYLGSGDILYRVTGWVTSGAYTLRIRVTYLGA